MSEKKADDKSEGLEKEAAPYNEYEQKCLEALKKEFGDEVVDGAPPGTVTRFIRGYAREKEPIEETLKRFKECVDWRAKSGADTVLDEPDDGEFMSEMKAFKTKWPTGIYGRGKHGRPVYIEQTGLVEPGEVFDKYPQEKIDRFHVYQMEQINAFKARLSEQYGKTFYKAIIVVDLTGFGTKHMGSKLRGPMKAMMHIDQHYYPESLHRMIVINAPWAFKMLWKIVRPWVHPLTQERIKFGKEHLWDHVDPHQVPTWIEGGKGRDVPYTEDELRNFDSGGKPPALGVADAPPAAANGGGDANGAGKAGAAGAEAEAAA